jgi:hypothetical protein
MKIWTKKGLLVLVFAGFVAGIAFALPEVKLSAGGGGYFTSDFGGGYEASYRGLSRSGAIPYSGGGMDYSLTDKLYLRGNILYGIRLASAVESRMVIYYERMNESAKTLLGHGLTIKVGVGYKF